VRQQRSSSPGLEWLTDRRLPGHISDAPLRVRVLRPSFVSLLMRPTAPSIWLGIAVAASLIVIETVAVVYLKRLTGQPFGTLYIVDVMVVSTVWGFGLSAITSVATAIAYTYFRNWPHAHVRPDELGFWRSNAVFLLVALLANTIAAVARTGERFSDLSSDLLATGGPQRLIQLNRRASGIASFPPGWPASAVSRLRRDRQRQDQRGHQCRCSSTRDPSRWRRAALNRRKHDGIPDRQPVRQPGSG
jgi:hypothetical protein